MADIEVPIQGGASGAIIDDDYRYLLWRQWSYPENPVDMRWCLFFMLNPSTADHTEDDPTIRRCIHFAKSTFYCHGLMVVNLFAARATDPKVLLSHPEPVGRLNDDYIELAVKKAAVVVCAWGSKADLKYWGGERRGSEYALRLMNMHDQVVCLGRTKHGYPRHPLYLKNETEPVPFPTIGD